MPTLQTARRLMIVACALGLTACASAPAGQGQDAATNETMQVQVQKSEPGELSPVVQAVMAGDQTRLQLILEQGGNPDATDAVAGREPALTALSTAIVWGRVDMVEALIEAGASVNKSIPGNGATPLHWASGLSSKEIEAGLVTQSEQKDLVRRLIEKGANVNARDSAGATPLFWAANAGASEVVTALLDAGAVPGIKSNVGTTAAIAALEAGHSDIAAMLRAQAPAEDSKQEYSSTSLAEAILSGDLPAVKTILASNPELAVSRSKRGYTPIILSLVGKQVDVALFLAKTYPDALSVPGQSDWTPLHFVYNSHKDFMFEEPVRRSLAQAMINNGAPLEAQTDDGMTPLLLATYNAMPDGVKVLLEGGANPDYRAPGNRVTPLMVSAITDLLSMESLLSNGADPELKDAQGRTVLHYLARGSDKTSSERAPALAEMLINSGAPINAQDSQLETPLMKAARAGNARLVAVLMANGADPTLQNNRGENAEYIALVEDHFAVIQAIRKGR